jgi:hypothetical protein
MAPFERFEERFDPLGRLGEAYPLFALAGEVA